MKVIMGLRKRQLQTCRGEDTIQTLLLLSFCHWKMLMFRFNFNGWSINVKWTVFYNGTAGWCLSFHVKTFIKIIISMSLQPVSKLTKILVPWRFTKCWNSKTIFNHFNRAVNNRWLFFFFFTSWNVCSTFGS